MSGWPRLWLRVPAIKSLSCSAFPSAGTVADTGVSAWPGGHPNLQHSLCSACSQPHSMEFQQTLPGIFGMGSFTSLTLQRCFTLSSGRTFLGLDWKVMKLWQGTNCLADFSSPRKKLQIQNPSIKSQKQVCQKHTLPNELSKHIFA